MQFQVPQFIDAEDKIVGPFTLRQFIYVGSAIGINFILFFNIKFWLWLILGILVLGAGLGLAFIKINGRPLTKVISAGFRYFWHPQVYVWQPEHHAAPKAAPTGETFSLEKLVAGFALKRAWQSVQTGSLPPDADPPKTRRREGVERYQIFRRVTGDKSAAKRVDYR